MCTEFVSILYTRHKEYIDGSVGLLYLVVRFRSCNGLGLGHSYMRDVLSH